MVNVVSEGAAQAKAAAHAAADTINENVDTLKDKAGQFDWMICMEFEREFFFVLADALKAGEKAAENAKATAGKKLNGAKKTAEELKKKASASVDDLFVKFDMKIFLHLIFLRL